MSKIKGLYIPFLIAAIYVASSINPSFAFEYGGVKWSATDIPVGYYINETTDDIPDEGTACQAAAQTWSDVATSSFEFQYLGPTTRLAPILDGYNVLSWGSTGGSIATTYIWYVGDTIIECDMEFEDDFNWGTNGASNLMDVQNIATHEFGHFLLLLDLYNSTDSEKTMYGYGSYGETKKRTLDPDDIAGISFIYPSTNGRTITADFTANSTSGDAPLTVQFTDLSAGDITGWLWDFGDGDTSTFQNPSHTYDIPGRYTVTLEVTGADGSDTVTKTDYIRVNEAAATPVITEIVPNIGPIGSLVTIYGSGFGDKQGRRGWVKFARRKKATIISWSDDIIECLVPDGARSGYVKVRNRYRLRSNRVYFTVTE